MYAKSHQFKVFEPNTEVKDKFYKFLDICLDYLEYLDNNNYKYVVIIPYYAKLDYNTDNSRYEYSITYAIINNTEPIKKGNIHKSPYVVFKKNTDKGFADKVREALGLKGKQIGVVLVSDYPLHEQLNRELRQEVESNTISIRSIYTGALYHHIVNTLKKGEQVGEVGLADICANISSGGKSFSRQKDKYMGNLMMCNTTAAAIAGIRKNNAVATINLDSEIVRAINIAIGVPINGFNVVLTNAEYIMEALQLYTRKSFSSRNEMENTRHYSSDTPKTNINSIDKNVKPYTELIKKIAEIFFILPKEADDPTNFLFLFDNDFTIFVKKFYDYMKGYDIDKLESVKLLNNAKHLKSILAPNGLLAKAIEAFVDNVIPKAQAYFNPPNDMSIAAGQYISSAINNLTEIIEYKKNNQYEGCLQCALITITYVFYALVYYGGSKHLRPKNEWDSYVKQIETTVAKIRRKPEQALEPLLSTSAASNPSEGDPQQPTTKIHILKETEFIDCHLYDRSKAVKYCKILLNEDADRDKHINEGSIKTILDIMEYLSTYSNGIFSNIDQITNINETSIPDVPINFNKYDVENLMLLTCDQNRKAIPLLYRQARIDAEFVSNNVALDIIDNKLMGNKYELNIIIFKRRELKIDDKMIEALDNLVKGFGEMVSKKVEAMAFFKDGVNISNLLSKYSFTGNLILIDDDPSQNREKLKDTLNQHAQYCFNLVYMIDDHQYLHEMYISYDEVKEYINKVSYRGDKIPLTSYLHYIIEYALYYRNSQDGRQMKYKDKTRYRVLVNEMSLKIDIVRLLAYIYLLFDIGQFAYAENNNTFRVHGINFLEEVSQKAKSVRQIQFSNKPYTVSLEPINNFISKAKDKEWYKNGFHRCNPDIRAALNEYYDKSPYYYEKFLESKQYKEHAHKIISSCQSSDLNVMNERMGRVYVSVIKPYEFTAFSHALIPVTKTPNSSDLYFEKLNKYINGIADEINDLYNSFSDKLKNHDTPEIDYNIEGRVLQDIAFNKVRNIKGTRTLKDKLQFLDKLGLEYLERIAFVMAVYMISQLRVINSNSNPYINWDFVLSHIFSQKDVPQLLKEHLTGLDEYTYQKAYDFSKLLGLSSNEFILLILTSRYLSSLYSSKDQDISRLLRELLRDLTITAASEVSVYRIQMLIAGIRMFLQNFICDLYSNSAGKDFMDANKFSGSYLILCEDSDLAAALASSIAIMLRFKSKTDKALKEIETLSRQFYSNVFKTLYKKDNKWYKRIIHSITGNKDNKYYNEELEIVNQTIDVINLSTMAARDFIIPSGSFDKNYPLYGLAALAFVLAIPMTLSLAVSLGERDNTNSMHGLVYRYQDTMSAYGITLSNRYCSAGYGMGELEWPEDTKMSQLIDFPVSTNIVKPENIFDRDNYNEAIITISEVLSHRAKNMNERLGQIIVTDDYTSLAIDMNNINTIIILSGRRSTLLQGQIQNTRILSEKVAWELYDQTNRKANVYYVAFEYDDRIQHIINDTYLKENLEHSITYARLGLNQSINNLYSVMSQVQVVRSGTASGSKTKKASKFEPIVLTIAIT